MVWRKQAIHYKRKIDFSSYSEDRGLIYDFILCTYKSNQLTLKGGFFKHTNLSISVCSVCFCGIYKNIFSTRYGRKTKIPNNPYEIQLPTLDVSLFT